MIQTSELDQRIEFLRPVVTGQDGSGGDILGTPLSLRTVWAKVQYLSGRELEIAMQRWAEVQYKLTIRRQPGLTIAPTDYAIWGSQTLDIRPPEGPGTRDDFWFIFAKDHVT